MKKELHVNFLLGVAVTLLILSATQVNCGVIVVHSSSSSSSSSGFGTWCNGLHCPPGSSCIAFTTIVNGNATSDKRCINIYGKVNRQETVTIANGEMCIRNLTTVGKKVNIKRSCRKLSKAELDNIEREEKDRQIQEAVQLALEREQEAMEDALERKQDALEDALERKQDALEDALEREEQQREWWHEKQERELEQKIEAIDRAKDQRNILDEFQKKLHQITAEARDEARERQADALEERLEREAEAREKLLEMQQVKLSQMERAALARQDKIDRKLDALNFGATVRGARWVF
ncbi:trichohyalin-like [Zootermopsis nevadensis]|uniref:Reticulocyte-binding protein 2-like protein a n=1 Tax=Zootermopsis nevadensis TaxID=136037 RepID=A0A067RKN3_ZOONE|nr:trichohyalin-like [Zootermopsis nevadensis]XP_021918736.1 trichohyalin-like [Zootermopsis nevadensis]KDR20059.1 hypothetical protein L798_05452 [Zootermopsis nevadensis]